MNLRIFLLTFVLVCIHGSSLAQDQDPLIGDVESILGILEPEKEASEDSNDKPAKFEYKRYYQLLVKEAKKNKLSKQEERELDAIYKVLSKHRQHLAVSMVRKFYPNHLFISDFEINSNSDTVLKFRFSTPKGKKQQPCVIMLDPEASMMEEAFKEHRISKLQTKDSKRSDELIDSYRIIYSQKNPFASHFVGNGYGVAYPVSQMMEKIEQISAQQISHLIQEFMQTKVVDEENVFLFATSEFADMALQIAAELPLRGVIIQEPNILISQQIAGKVSFQSDSETPDRNCSEQQIENFKKLFQKRYANLKSPIYHLRNTESSLFKLYDQALIPVLIDQGNPLSILNHTGPFRQPVDTRGKEEKPVGKHGYKPVPMDWKARYAHDQTMICLNAVLLYLGSNSTTKAEQLPIYLGPENKRKVRLPKTRIKGLD